ncbi:unnamed protein product, partial [Sphenostylis stenocarpa]
ENGNYYKVETRSAKSVSASTPSPLRCYTGYTALRFRESSLIESNGINFLSN